MTRLKWTLVVLAFVGVPVPAAAQSAANSAIAGVVMDTTGAVLPGVTVEASSPALIEKMRAGLTDEEGNYKIVDLQPGTYTVTFTLAGFNVLKREGIVVTSGFTAPVNADMQVGDVNETVTVSGASPVVDVQNTRTQTVLSEELLSSAPTARQNSFAFSALIVGLNIGSGVGQDVGGSMGEVGGAVAYHGISSGDSRWKLDGMDYNTLNASGGGNNKSYHTNYLAMSETNMGLGSHSAEYETAGVQMNMIPKEGGNRFSMTGVAVYTNGDFQADNLSDELRARGLQTVGDIDRDWDVGAAVGGPIRSDKLWFFVAPKYWGVYRGLPGAFYNATQHTPFYTPDLNQPLIQNQWDKDLAVRLTWQTSQKHKVSFGHNEQRNCTCAITGSATTAPESGVSFRRTDRITQGSWTYPATNRLLFQSGVSYTFNGTNVVPTGDVLPTDIRTTDSGTGQTYGSAAAAAPGISTYSDGMNTSNPLAGRFSASYVTGSHALKVGWHGVQGWHDSTGRVNQSISYQFLNRRPTGLTQYADPYAVQLRLRSHGLFAQDQWTMSRLTLNLGVRFDYFKSWVEPQVVPAGRFLPERRFEGVDNVPNFKDINPRLGAAYDLFGNGKTAIKGSFGRYVTSLGSGLAEQNTPALRAVATTTRTWDDRNANYEPDCDLTNFALNGECGQIANNLFGTVVPGTTFADDVLTGSGNRIYTLQGSISLQQELRPGLSATIGYFRNSYGNINANVNTRVTAADFTFYCVTAPIDPRLPGGGGYQVCGNYDVAPSKFGQVSTLVQQADGLGVGELSRVFNGVDITINGRFGGGVLLSGGVAVGRSVVDDCALNESPQALAGTGYTPDDLMLGQAVHPLDRAYCHVAPPWSQSTQVKINGVYPLPWGIEVAGVFQNLPGRVQFANRTYTNAEIAPSLGRNLSSGPNGVVSIPILAPQTSFENRLTQFDVRLSKVFRLPASGRVKATLDIYNLFNANAVTGINPTYGARWLEPTAIMVGRYGKIGAQIDF